MGFNVKIKIGGKLARLQSIVRSDKSGQFISQLFQQLTRIYTAFIRRRFARASRGDGTWKELSPVTIARRRKHSRAILRDTGLLFSQLSPDLAPPSPIQKVGEGVFKTTVVFGGTATYPNGVTVTDVMSFHQKGGGRLPQRKIIVDPDPKTMQQMAASAKRIALNAIKNER